MSTGLLALITAIVTLVGIIVSHLQQAKKIQEIHVLVNSRLSTALDRVAVLEGKLAEMRPRDPVQAETARIAQIDAKSRPHEGDVK